MTIDRIVTKQSETTPQAGFSLIELMISTAVFLIFMGAVYGLLRIGTIQKTTVNSQTEVLKNLRLSLNMIGRDAVNAGLGYNRVGGYMPDNLTNARMNIQADSDAWHDLLTSVIAGNNVNGNIFLLGGERTDVIAFAYRDMDFNDGNPLVLTSASDNGSTGVNVTTRANDASRARSYDLYLISDGTRNAVALATSVPSSSSIRFQTADPLGINQIYTTNSANVRSRLVRCVDYSEGCMDYAGSTVTAKKFFWVSYSVLADGTLVRTTYGNNSNGNASQQIQTQPLAYNIRNFQVRYLLSDGTVTDDPSNGGAAQENLNRVVQIEVTVSSQVSIRENGVDIEKVVELKSTFSTKNLNYDIG